MNCAQAVCVARGGRGGLGTFAKSQRRARNDPDLADVLVDMAPKEFCQGGLAAMEHENISMLFHFPFFVLRLVNLMPENEHVRNTFQQIEDGRLEILVLHVLV